MIRQPQRSGNGCQAAERDAQPVYLALLAQASHLPTNREAAWARPTAKLAWLPGHTVLSIDADRSLSGVASFFSARYNSMLYTNSVVLGSDRFA